MDDEEKKLAIDEEARAEEEFIADREDTVENHPLVDEAAVSEATEMQPEKEKKEALTGAIGSGDLKPEEKSEPVNNEAQIQTEAPAASEAQPVQTSADAKASEAVPKKKKTGRVVALVVCLVLLLCAGIGLVFFLNWYESKDKMLADAMTKFITSESRQTSGVVVIEPKELDEDDKNAVRKISFTLNGENEKVNSSFNGKIDVQIGEETVGFDADLMYLAGGEFYFRLGDTKELKEALGGLMPSSSGDDSTKMIESLLAKFSEKVSGQWYKFAVEDFLGDDEGSNVLRCKINAAEALANKENLRVFADLYKDYSFIRVDDDKEHSYKDGVNSIPVLMDAEAAEGFAKTLPKLGIVKAIGDCDDSNEDDEADENVTVKMSEDDKMQVSFLVKAWSHELVGVEAQTESEDAKVTIALNFDYKASKKFGVPTETKSAEELSNDLKEAYVEALTEYAQEYYEARCKAAGVDDVKACTDRMMKYVKDSADDFEADEIFESVYQSLRRSNRV